MRSSATYGILKHFDLYLKQHSAPDTALKVSDYLNSIFLYNIALILQRTAHLM